MKPMITAIEARTYLEVKKQQYRNVKLMGLFDILDEYIRSEAYDEKTELELLPYYKYEPNVECPSIKSLIEEIYEFKDQIGSRLSSLGYIYEITTDRVYISWKENND